MGGSRVQRPRDKPRCRRLSPIATRGRRMRCSFMVSPLLRRHALLGAGLAFATPMPARAQKTASVQIPSFRLEEVASFPHQVTGVTAAPDGRVFVSFPRWTEDTPVSVAELAK